MGNRINEVRSVMYKMTNDTVGPTEDPTLRYIFADPVEGNPFYTIADTHSTPVKIVATLLAKLPMAKLYTIGLAYMLNNLYGESLEFNPLHFTKHTANESIANIDKAIDKPTGRSRSADGKR